MHPKEEVWSQEVKEEAVGGILHIKREVGTVTGSQLC